MTLLQRLLLFTLTLFLLLPALAGGVSRARWIDLYEQLYGVTLQQREGLTPFEGTLDFQDDSMVVAWKDAYTLGSLLTMYRATGEREYLRRFTAKVGAIYPGFTYRQLTSERATVRDEVTNGGFETAEDFSRYTPLPVIANGEFEAAHPQSPALPSGWTPWGNSAASVALVDVDPASGRYVTVRTNPASQWQILEQPIAYTPGMLYGVSGLARSTDPVYGARVEVYDYTAKAVLATQYCKSAAWTRLSFTVRMPAAGHNVRLRLYHGHYNVQATDAFDAVALCDPWEMGVLGYHDLPGWTRANAVPQTAHLLPLDEGALPNVIDVDGRIRVNSGQYRLQLLADPGNGPTGVEQPLAYVPGARYGVRGYGKATSGGMTVLDRTTGAELASVRFTVGEWREGVADFTAPAEPGHQLVLRLYNDAPLPDAPAQFDNIAVKRHFPHLVHDGQIGSALAEFALLVHDEPALQTEFGATADALLSLVTSGIIPAWEPYWRDLPDGRGTYIFPSDESNGYNGQSYPYNEQLALGRVFIYVSLLDGDPAARERAERMARAFKDALRLVNGAYQWNYWDLVLPEDSRKIAIEDTSHGNLDVHFADLACRAGIVFTTEDMRRFANTFLTRIWNGSLSAPRLNLMIDGSGDFNASARRNFARWIELTAYDARARQVAETIFAKNTGELNADLSAFPHRASFFALSAAELVWWKPFTRVSLAAPSLVAAGMPVTPAATVDGTGAEYRFFVSNTTGWTDLRGYASSSTSAWTPTVPGTYTLLVWAREPGSPNAWDAYATLPITVTPALSAVSLSVDGHTLTATPTGGARVEYRFFAMRQGDTTWTQLRRYGADPTCAWTPSTPGKYTLLVWAREVGKSSTWDVYKTVEVSL